MHASLSLSHTHTPHTSIREQAEPFGICKVIPPADAWFSTKNWLREVNLTRFSFASKLQPIHMLLHRTNAVAVFLAHLAAFTASARSVTSVAADAPLLGARPAPLFSLYRAVVARGGFKCIENDLSAWRAVLTDCKLRLVTDALARRAEALYRQDLLAYEQHQQARAPLTEPAEIAAFLAANGDVRRRLHDFSYADGGSWTLSRYRRMARTFKAEYFAVNNEADADDDAGGDDDDDDESVDDDEVVSDADVAAIEREYWRIVESPSDAVNVVYGNDLSCVRCDSLGTHAEGGTQHTLFPTSARNDLTYCAWNLNCLARVRGSLLRYARHTLPGITDPMLYVGMVFSSFCWHTEDNYLASINYLHGGAPKVWYGVPGVHRARFEALMRAQHAELFERQPDLLHQLVTSLSPRTLQQHGVACVRAVQRGGEFVVTFPGSFHAGFNTGFNVAEATNFGTEAWLPHGRRSLDDYHRRGGSRPSAFSFHNLLCMAARGALAGDMTRETARTVVDELRVMRHDLLDACSALAAAGVTRVDRFPRYGGDSDNVEVDLIQCFDCQVDCFLLAVVCPCTPPGRISCPKHFDRLCACQNGSKCQLLRYSDRKLQKLLAALDEQLPRLPTLAELGPATRAQIKADALAIENWRRTREGRTAAVDERSKRRRTTKM
jgi:hypothetical protein